MNVYIPAIHVSGWVSSEGLGLQYQFNPGVLVCRATSGINIDVWRRQMELGGSRESKVHALLFAQHLGSLIDYIYNRCTRLWQSCWAHINQLPFQYGPCMWSRLFSFYSFTFQSSFYMLHLSTNRFICAYEQWMNVSQLVCSLYETLEIPTHLV
jgi:hypothetical protein